MPCAFIPAGFLACGGGSKPGSRSSVIGGGCWLCGGWTLANNMDICLLRRCIHVALERGPRCCCAVISPLETCYPVVSAGFVPAFRVERVR